jgi:hypothetical protein
MAEGPGGVKRKGAGWEARRIESWEGFVGAGSGRDGLDRIEGFRNSGIEELKHCFPADQLWPEPVEGRSAHYLPLLREFVVRELI